jgi:hypothetical protein
MSHRFEIEPGETIAEQWVAGIPGKSGKKVNWGGTLFLTDRRLIWEVTRLMGRKGVFRLTPDGLVLRGLDAAVRAVLGDRSGIVVPLGEITDVRPDDVRGSILHVDTTEGSLRLLTTASKWGYNERNDGVVRDSAVARIRAARGIPG